MSGDKTKDLKDMSLEELWELFPIIFSEPLPEKWKEQFEREKLEIEKILGNDLIAVHHVGSTAVGTIKAKPIVDIVAEVGQDRLDVCADRLEKNGYIVMSRGADRISLNKGYTPEGYADEVFHIHLRKKGDADEVYFCWYLRRHPAAAKEYEALKLRLKEKYGRDRDAYTAAKTDFVTEITAKAKKEKLK